MSDEKQSPKAEGKVKLKAVGRIPYGVGFREHDEAFEAPQADAELLISLGRAKRAGKAEKDDVLDSKQEGETGKAGRYDRRDLKAK